MSFDLLLDPTSGDISFTDSGDLASITTIEDSFKQRLGIRLRTNRGEWAFNTTYGVPYTEQIIGSKLPKRDIDAIIQTEALLEEDVDVLIDYTSEYTRDIREYSAEFKVVTPTGVISVVLPTSEVDEYIYPPPSVQTLTTGCDLTGAIEITNDLYEFVNFNLPIEGNSTWYDITGFIAGSSSLYETVNLEIPSGGSAPWI